MKQTEINEASSRTESNDCDNGKRQHSLLDLARERKDENCVVSFQHPLTKTDENATPKSMLCQNEMKVVATQHNKRKISRTNIAVVFVGGENKEVSP